MPADTPDRGLAACESGDRHSRIGAALRAARESRGEHLDEIAQWLRIQPAFLAALEVGDLRSLPGRVYAAGFLRSYAEHLGLDLQGLDRRHRNTISSSAPTVASIHRKPGWSQFPDMGVLVAILVLLSAAACGYYIFLGVDFPAAVRLEATPSPVTASAAESPPIAILAAVDDDSGPRIVPAAQRSGRVVLVGRAPGWIRLSEPTGDFVRSWSVGPGDWIPVPAQRGLTLSTGDAGSIEILVDGRSVGMAGAAAAVVRELPLDPDTLLARLSGS